MPLLPTPLLRFGLEDVKLDEVTMDVLDDEAPVALRAGARAGQTLSLVDHADKVDRMILADLAGKDGKPLLSEDVQRVVDELVQVGGGQLRASGLRTLFDKFRILDKSSSGKLGYPEFCRLVDKEDSAMSRKMYGLFDKEGSGVVDIREFLVGMSSLTDASREEKSRFAFLIFDEDGSGNIEVPELLRLLKANFLVQTSQEAQVERRVEIILSAAGRRALATRSLTSKEYTLVASKHPGLMYPSNEDLDDIERAMRK
jgi:Ca2+-binding EF-hand superfamily protein